MKRLLFIIALCTVVSCVRDNFDMGNGESKPIDKIFMVSDNAAPGRLLVRLSSPDAQLAVEGVELNVEPMFPSRDGSKFDSWVIVSFDEALNLGVVAEKVAANSSVERVEYDVIMKRIEGKRVAMPTDRPASTRATNLPFNDPELEYQWHYHNDGTLSSLCSAGADINLLNAWKYTAGDNRVIVAVCDGGIMTTHKDIVDNLWVNLAEKNGKSGVDDDGNGYVDDIHGYNFVTDKGNVTADAHGTHVAGTISAVNNNGFAVCGIAGGTGNGDGVRLMSIQIFEGDKSCSTSEIVRGICYAADNGAVILNCSWGYEPDSYNGDKVYESRESLLKEALTYFKSKARLEGAMEGGLVVFAAGNEAYAESTYPGAHRDYISVSAMSSDFKAAYYTNYGPGVNVCAPGGDETYGTILTVSSASVEYANDDGYEYMQGTSMACPHVSGCAALAVSYALKQGYTLTSDELHRLILTSVHDINQYQTTKSIFDYVAGVYNEISLEPYIGKLGSGYIDAHLLLMQMDSTPCVYLVAGEEKLLSLDSYFGEGSEDLSLVECNVSDSVRNELGIERLALESGQLRIKATKSGSGRVSVKAIVGGDHVGGDHIGGSYVEREFEIVARGSVAANGGWL